MCARVCDLMQRQKRGLHSQLYGNYGNNQQETIDPTPEVDLINGNI